MEPPDHRIISGAGWKRFADLDQVQHERILLSCARFPEPAQADRVPVTENCGAASLPFRNRIHTDLGIQRVPRDVRNLIVADGSCFPTATGVNPTISIEAVAYMNAKRLAAALT
jgi:hypothetical protein